MSPLRCWRTLVATAMALLAARCAVSFRDYPVGSLDASIGGSGATAGSGGSAGSDASAGAGGTGAPGGAGGTGAPGGAGGTGATGGSGGSGATGGTDAGGPACVRYVRAGVAAGGDGTSWAKALGTVQGGIDAATAAGAPCEVWVAAGVYYVYQSAAADSVTLRDGIDVYGGFAGNETQRGARDWNAHVTTLNGRSAAGSSLRVAHVVTAEAKAALDGFTITGGNAPSVGGGINATSGSPTIRHCTITGNSATDTGGGASLVGGNALVEDCTFSSNHAGQSAAGLRLAGSGTATRCVFADNSSDVECGGVALDGTATVENSIFHGNQSTDFAGGLCVGPGAGAVHVLNNTFYDNHAPHGGGGFSINNDTSVSANNIATSNTGQYGPNILLFAGKLGDIHNNCGDGGMSGSNNVVAAPQMVNAAGGDFHLLASSPCIDEADDSLAPPRDFAGTSRYDDPGVGTSVADIGALEYHP